MSIFGEALAGLLQKIGCHVEIALGGFDVDVAEIRREPWQQTLDIAARTIPRDDSMDRGRVSNVVDARRPTFAGGANDTGCSSDIVKQRVHMRVRPSSARLRCKETRIIAQRQGKFAPALNIDSQFPAELWSDRHQPCLEEFRVTNGDDLLDEVDIAQGQIEGPRRCAARFRIEESAACGYMGACRGVLLMWTTDVASSSRRNSSTE